ncbi:fungal trichothecene efflux pump [Exophiala viscosa]|uniref:fungal trichothecene efflux pump n=1 Tax=Exophiala viscosa TaxID=2486360 RepID=UPI0021947578|nr:fungal trichothecene efflux pump [Exophiala viscosa]
MVASFFITGLVAFMLCGHGSDMLGRRWFMIAGNIFVPVGYIIAATAKTFDTVIAGMAIAGVGGAICQTATFTAPELLPNKWRPAAVAGADSIVLVACTVCPVAARYSLQHGTWRWLLWVPVIGNSICAIILFLFYFPPKHPRGLSFRDAVKQIDYIGGLLFTAAAVLILVGVVFASYLPSADGRVTGTLVGGFVALIGFACWETLAPIKQALTPPRLFRVNRGKALTAPFLVAFMVPVYYLGTNIIWGQIVNAIFSPGEPSSPLSMELSIVQGLGMCTGGVLLSVLGRRIKHWQWQLFGSVTIMTLFGGLLALVSPDRKKALIAFNFISSIAFAWAQFLSITFCQFGAPQTELGVVGALGGVGRFGGNCIATTVYVTVITRSSTSAALTKVPAAVIAAGGTQAMGLALLAAIPAGTKAIMAVPGVTVAIADAAGAAYIASLIVAIRTVALVSVAFGGVGMIGSLWVEDIGPKMNNHIEVFLENDVQAAKNTYH